MCVAIQLLPQPGHALTLTRVLNLVSGFNAHGGEQQRL